MAAFSEAGCCGLTKADLYTLCPAGYYYQIDQAACLKLPADGTCPEGYSADDHTRTCQPLDPGSDPRCTAILVEFPLYELVVKQSTRCYKDPEERNEIVSSLDAFSIVTVLGIGEDRQTLVIKNPDYQVPCWASVDDFYSDDLDLNILPIIVVD
jgi:hypothetical protein